MITGNYTLGCQAALAGHGLFLSPQEFISGYLINGDLILALPFVANSPRPYIIEHKPGTSNLTADVFEWIWTVAASELRASERSSMTGLAISTTTQR